MATVDTDRIVSMSDASSKGMSALVKDATEHGYTIISRRNSPAVAVVAIDRYTALQEAEEDARDLTVLVDRLLHDDGQRVSLDTVLDKLGYTREELAAIPD
jgi:PHD/YefM family antitoxin component YafN of YafNO toxin-antitoxin module